MIDEVAMKDEQVITLAELPKQTLEQIHYNYMGIKTRLLAQEAIYWITLMQT